MLGMELELTDLTQSVFFSNFGYPAETLMQAPGRVNLIGEHTDYNGGFVLPCAIDRQLVAASAKRADQLIRVVAVDYQSQMDQFCLEKGIVPNREKHWANFVRGVAKALISRGIALSGADIVFAGNIPLGAGLSSSAALAVAITKSLLTLSGKWLSEDDIALIGQQAENEFIGCRCGIMDQLASVKGRNGHALLLDCRSLETLTIPIPEDLSLLVINSNVRRELVDSEYNLRRKQCEEAEEFFGVTALRDISLEDLDSFRGKLSEEVVRRVRHVVTENARTLSAADALENNDIPLLSRLMDESHSSLREDFNVTVPEVDLIVDIVGEMIGDRGGVRMTGGGFGGCVIALIPHDLVDATCKEIDRYYESKTCLTTTIYRCRASGGAGEILT